VPGLYKKFDPTRETSQKFDPTLETPQCKNEALPLAVEVAL